MIYTSKSADDNLIRLFINLDEFHLKGWFFHKTGEFFSCPTNFGVADIWNAKVL